MGHFHAIFRLHFHQNKAFTNGEESIIYCINVRLILIIVYENEVGEWYFWATTRDQYEIPFCVVWRFWATPFKWLTRKKIWRPNTRSMKSIWNCRSQCYDNYRSILILRSKKTLRWLGHEMSKLIHGSTEAPILISDALISFKCNVAMMSRRLQKLQSYLHEKYM